tara:strand:- start:45019 stop:45564 length:546 start_codon:yes stop_codon:yes gene_type:complete
MAIISTQTTVTIGDAVAVVTTADMVLQASVTGSLALRKLTYPTTAFAPIVYTQNPDEWINFDTSPMVKRPSVGTLRTLEDTKLTGWQGYARDASITETWKGGGSKASMDLDFFRQLYAYYENPPTTGLIQWAPCDRTSTVYNILIESLTAGGTGIGMDFLAARQLCVLGNVVLRFRIVSEV